MGLQYPRPVRSPQASLTSVKTGPLGWGRRCRVYIPGGGKTKAAANVFLCGYRTDVRFSGTDIKTHGV